MAATKLYHYEPSFIPALVVLGLCFASTLVCLMQMVRFETVGYGCRVWSSQESPNWSTLPYAIQTFTLISGPFLMLATIYMTLSKIIILLDADIHSLVPVKVLPKVFIFGDLISLAAQLTGAAYLVDAIDVSQQRTAQLIIVGGLSFHVYFFGFFSSVLHIAYTRVLEAPTRQSSLITMPWRRWILVLYISCGLILVRSVYRVIEYATGPLGVVQGTEIYFYVFDAGSIFIITCLFNIFHPRQLAVVSKDDLPDPETIVVTPSKPLSRYPPQTPPRYMQPPPFLPSHANLRNLSTSDALLPAAETSYTGPSSTADQQDQQELQYIVELVF
ncbi:hypothetical protein FPOAC1_007020 [Fusarium poae]|uniref:hypothetical protein n=1 Tax=Fusarium poae TaxID=36050 RepID=UPI001CE837EE|nr:hypothetical protein FPOAC1_007020 [Fusarium poae]KAG8673704.1 hypothetical protein FPOAC1_007020 [Fusarium poae]